jgi:hypothetical protein
MARKKKETTEPASRGLSATEVASGAPSAAAAALSHAIARDGGVALASDRDPLGVRRGADQSASLPTGAKADFDETIEKMLSAARKFKADSVKPEQLARAGGAADE